jgi:transposase-like protein
MPQLQLPFFPAGMTLINANVGFHLEEGTITYFYGNLPVFRHEVDDHRSFRMITSQLYINGSVKQAEICRAFGIPAINVKRSVKVYRDKGIAGFFEEPRRRGAAVLTQPVIVEVQRYLDQGKEITEIAVLMDLLADTLHKAVRSGRLHKPKKKM